ncbi:F0F1 ATP synthase subunit A [Amycolatopsis alkalitolerans]|uniref:ATP synthase subunit a n=1 Tax=Amycolatopsis alkalitolerans TaxID=2547244 RepID=A0A5C4LWA3_9PSEU|nr:F0F1 ATP synthase subunit A [Amycolatopsis alkalitolerans]TNC22090.1 F0F1 ATP synthase subunit A [Amycolatopsis alkalitolerans]
MTQVLAAEVEVGHHSTFELFGMTFNSDTILATVIAAAIVIVLAFVLRAKVTSGVPSGIQLAWESVTTWIRGQVESSIGVRVAPFVVPLAVTLFVFILVSNWLSVLPAQTTSADFIPPPASDTNFTFALALTVFVWYHAAGMRRRGAGKHAAQLVKGHVAFLAPINVIEEIAKPISLSLRLFGNVFAGTILVSLIAMFPAYILWAPNLIWKSFDLFVGFIQAFIFALLTVLYFGQAMETHEEH